MNTDYREQCAMFVADTLLIFREITTKEERLAMVARLRGINDTNASLIACFITSIDNQDSSNLAKYSQFLIDYVFTKIKDYIDYFGFIPQKADPIKINFYFILALYNYKCIEDLKKLKKIIKYILEKENQCVNNNDDKVFYLVDKAIEKVSKIGDIQKNYGDFGLYKIYKLTYQLARCECSKPSFV